MLSDRSISARKVSNPVREWDRQFRLVGVHHEHREELGRLRLVGMALTLTQREVSTPRGPVPNERRRRRPPHGRRTGTTGEWPPATRGSPPAPAEDGPGRGPPPLG